MATIITSEVLEETPNRGTKRNLYRFTFDDGTAHLRRGWIPQGASTADDMAARGAALIDELARAEIDGLLA